MSAVKESATEFERNARVVLEESVRRVDGRTRSRLNQARHAALAAAATRRRGWWRSFTLMPAGAVAAAVLVAVVLWQHEPQGTAPLAPGEAQHAAVEDMDLLTDNDSIDLMEGWDGSFYEWAASQSDDGGESS
jgi:cytochrome c-type biogenesis protein CcmH/NrfG